MYARVPSFTQTVVNHSMLFAIYCYHPWMIHMPPCIHYRCVYACVFGNDVSVIGTAAKEQIAETRFAMWHSCTHILSINNIVKCTWNSLKGLCRTMCIARIVYSYILTLLLHHLTPTTDKTHSDVTYDVCQTFMTWLKRKRPCRCFLPHVWYVCVVMCLLYDWLTLAILNTPYAYIHIIFIRVHRFETLSGLENCPKEKRKTVAGNGWWQPTVSYVCSIKLWENLIPKLIPILE